MITGMARAPADGRFAVLPPIEHLHQSIMDIITTPIGTRVMRPEYGSRVPRLIDHPVTQAWKLEIFVAITEALGRWEPRIHVDKVAVDSVGPGSVGLTVTYSLKNSGKADSLSFEVERIA